MARKLCQFFAWAFAIAYVLALAILIVGTFGLFGQERDPLSAAYLLPLGLPWNQLIEGFSDSVRPWLAAAAPLLNLAIIRGICGLLERSHDS